MTLATLTPQEEERRARRRERDLAKARREAERSHARARKQRARQLKAFRDWNEREGVLHQRLLDKQDAIARRAWLDHWCARPPHPAEVKA